jgi:branched-chain amino acid transport system substrate-binding protein
VIKRILMAGFAAGTLTLVGGSASPQEQPLRIGLNVALSGPAAPYGVPIENGLRMLIDEVNARDKGIAGHPVQLVVYDTEGSTAKAAQLFRRLTESDHVDVVLGPTTSGESLAVLPAANEAQVPVIVFGGAAAITTPTTPFVFNTAPTDRLVVERMMQEFAAHNITRLGIIYSSDAYGQSGARAIKDEAPKFGVSIAADETFSPQDTSMTPQMIRIRDSDAQAILVWSANPGPSIVMRNAQDLGVKLPLYLSYASGSRAFLTQTGPAAEDSFVAGYRIVSPETLPDSDPIKAELVAFDKEYQDRWKTELDFTAGYAYDSVRILEAAMKDLKGPLTPVSLRDAIEGMTANGATGQLRFSPDNHRGVGKDAVVIMQAKGGHWVNVKP